MESKSLQRLARSTGTELLGVAPSALKTMKGLKMSPRAYHVVALPTGGCHAAGTKGRRGGVLEPQSV